MSVEKLKAQTGLERTKPAHERSSLLANFGTRYQIDPSKVLSVLSATVFRAGKKEDELSLEEMQAALIVANQYQLNPFTKEIYAFRSQGKLLIVVSVDGWSVLVNRQPQLDGIEFSEQFDDKGHILSITCRMHRKDRRIPTVVTEYLSECKRNTGPWGQSPIRMLRHRAFIQCARVAFSISGVMDEEDAARMPGAAFIDAEQSGRPTAGTFQPSGYINAEPQQDEQASKPSWSAEADKLFDALKVPANQREVMYANCGSDDAELIEYLQQQMSREEA